MQSLNWRPAHPPVRRRLNGRTVRLEPLDASRHGDDLFGASVGADATWNDLAYGPFASRDDFARWLEARAVVDNPMTWTIIDLESGEARGLESPMRVDAQNGVIEIGHICGSVGRQCAATAATAKAHGPGPCVDD